MKESNLRTPSAFSRGSMSVHVNGHFWGFPKGHLEQGEEPFEGALRELFEETALTIRHHQEHEAYQEEYTYRHKDGCLIHKRVYYFVCEIDLHSHPTLDSREILDGRWVTLTEAMNLLTYQESQNVLQSVIKKLSLEEL